MSHFQTVTPVAFIIFNRPDTTEQVFAEIARARPPKLLVVGDGPRAGRDDEVTKVAKARAVIDRVNWPCEVLTNYSEVNLGCKRRVSSGLDWVFEHVPEAIILEDDCLPHPTFFRFCEELLARYRDDERVGMISGDNFQFGRNSVEESYYFSIYNHIWGWASWRRAWKHYDVTAARWPTYRDSRSFASLFPEKNHLNYWSEIFQSVFENNIDTWDYQWTLALWMEGMLSVLPNVNLVTNIGFGADATHTKNVSSVSNLDINEVSFPLVHPSFIVANSNADMFTTTTMFSTKLHKKLLTKLNVYLARIISKVRGS